MKMVIRYFSLLAVAVLAITGCATPRISLVSGDAIPLKEYTLQGTQKDKVLVIPVKGKISDDPKFGLLSKKPSMVQEIVAQLRKAEKDKRIRAILLKIDSPGGPVTASDLLYHEISEYKKRSGAKVVVSMMNMAASGGYYIALPADFIVAHPTSITGSVGVIFLQPKVDGLMEKIGVGVDVNTSGKYKDAGSPFRETLEDERKIFQDLTDRLGKRFVELVRVHRNLDEQALAETATARIFLADDALKLRLIDQIGYLGDAIAKAKDLAGLPPDARVIVYRRIQYPNDTVYNTRVSAESDQNLNLVNIDLMNVAGDMQAGFYYLWPTAVGK
jgi:protease-4